MIDIFVLLYISRILDMPPKKKELPIIDSDIKLIRKANELVEARYKFDIWETRVFAFMLTLIKHEDTDFREYQINAGDIVREFGLHDSGQVYDSIKSAGEKLLDKKVGIIRTLDDGRKEQFTTHLVASTATPEERGRGDYIKLSFHPALRPFLLELKERYLVYDIRNILSLSSIYSVRLFELLKQYQKIGKRKFRVDELKTLLSIEPNEYQLYGHFKGLIKRAEKDLLKHTDIYFTFEEDILKKKVVAITFNIFDNPNNQREKVGEKIKPKEVKAIDTSAEELERIYATVSNYVTKAKVKKWLKDLPIEQIEKGIAYTINYIKAGNTVNNIGGMLNTMVSTPNLYDKYEVTKTKVKKEAKKVQVNTALIEEKKAELQHIWQEYKIREAEAVQKLLRQNATLRDELVQRIQANNFYDPQKSLDENLQRDIIQGLKVSILSTMSKEYDTMTQYFNAKVKKTREELVALGYKE